MDGIHNWHDWVFTIGGGLLGLSLIPSIISSHKPSWKTSIMTAIILFVFSCNYFSMEMYKSSAITFLSSLLWAVLFFQVVLKRFSFQNAWKTLKGKSS